MRRIFTLFALAGLLGCGAVRAQDSEWQSLFNGKDLSGWDHVGAGGFVVEDGMLKTDGGMGMLWYTGGKISDSVVRVVYRSVDTTNAGVFIRIPEAPTEPWMPVHRGYEVQIDDREDDYHATGVLYSLTRAMARPGIPDAWNTMEIYLDGDRTVVTVNGVLVTYYREGDPVGPRTYDYEPERGRRPTEGYIGLQNHGPADLVYFKEVSIRRLGQ